MNEKTSRPRWLDRAPRLRFLEKGLFGLAFLLLISWFVGTEGSRLYLALASGRGEQEVVGTRGSADDAGDAGGVSATSTSTSAPAIAGSSLGRISIPRLGVSAAILEGTSHKALLLGVGHVEGSAGPGAPGRMVLAGHRDTVFRPLKDVRKDDLIWVETDRGSYVYKVLSTQVVDPRPIDLSTSSSARELTLVTCFPFRYIGSAPKRYLVTARELGSDF